ncbi:MULTISPECIES: RHS repeat-associated core domain-containing protein [Pirellulaceae]|uniref:RHS repeat-associated core domain-containing protein n=1 Tax=Pirellulaceae TaxID=2691357 RepID=UPI001304BBAD|nr:MULTISPECIES: RHS repeat-associated core domain-containing protein [Pirellulaceae]
MEEEITPQEGSPYRYEYVWGIRGQDDLICREKYDSQSNLLERLYSLSDANGNVVGLIPEAENYLNRLITYDPYGTPTDESDFRQLFGGYYYDSDTGLYLVRNRVYHPKLGRWLTKDPLGMVDGPNLYEYCAGDPVNLIDPSGEAIPLILYVGAFAIAAAHGWSQTILATNGEASLGEQALGTGLGALGGFNPFGAYGSALGSIGGYYGGEATGAWDPNQGYQWGGLAGLFVGDIGGILRRGAVAGIPQAARQFGWRTVLSKRARNVAPELLSLGGGIAGATIGSQLTDDPLLGANLGMMAGGAPGGLWRLGRTIRTARLANFRVNSTRFYSVLSDKAAARLAAGGEPWPTGMNRANLGEGLYVWGRKSDAVGYFTKRSLKGDFDPSYGTAIRSFRISNSRLRSFSRIDLRQVSGEAFDQFTDTYTAYADDMIPHGFDYVIYPRALGTEHFFDKRVYRWFRMRT